MDLFQYLQTQVYKAVDMIYHAILNDKDHPSTLLPSLSLKRLRQYKKGDLLK